MAHPLQPGPGPRLNTDVLTESFQQIREVNEETDCGSGGVAALSSGLPARGRSPHTQPLCSSSIRRDPLSPATQNPPTE